MAEGTFVPITIKSFSGGWVSTLDREPDALRTNESPDLENVIFDGQGSFIVRPGYELFGNRLSTAGSILRLHTFRRPIRDDEILMRQRATTLEYYHIGTAQWETVPIVGSIAAGAKLGLINYTSATDTVDYVYYSDGSTLTLQRWNGGHTQLNGALAGGEATVTVDSTTGFTTTGSIDIGGTTVTYTGKTATTFTGCAGTPAAADNLAVEQVADNFSASSGSKPLGNIMAVVNGQLAVAVNQYVKISDIDDFTDWGSGNATTKGFSGGKITALAVKNKKLIVHTANAIQALSYEFTSDLTGFQIRVEDIVLAPGYGAKVFTGIVNVGEGSMFHISGDGAVRRTVQSEVSELFDTGSVSNNIKNTLAKYTMTNASGIFFKNKAYFCVQSDDGSINDIVLVNDMKYARENESGEAWSKWRLYINDFAVYGGRLYFASSADPNVYVLFTDDSGDALTNDDGAAIPWYYSTPLLDFGKPELKFVLNKFISRGFITQNSEVTYKILYDYGVTGESEQQFLGSNEDFVFVPAAEAMGEEVIGEGGITVDQFDGLYPFTYPTDYGSTDAFNIQVVVSGQTKDERYKQTRLILYVEPQDDVLTN